MKGKTEQRNKQGVWKASFQTFRERSHSLSFGNVLGRSCDQMGPRGMWGPCWGMLLSHLPGVAAHSCCEGRKRLWMQSQASSRFQACCSQETQTFLLGPGFHLQLGWVCLLISDIWTLLKTDSPTPTHRCMVLTHTPA